ncbi:hypothetical protein ACIQCF_37115 [Streptomyces sp. NPDC088353]|uniref:hypothetical protein n=1 Tax=Streptomyces sp. NPDC088353 TaxID=3365855 RepID=UPI0037F1B4DF
MVVQFTSAWGSPRAVSGRRTDYRLLPATGTARDTSALALWTYTSPLVTGPGAQQPQVPPTAADVWDLEQWAGLQRARRAVAFLGARGADAWLEALGRDPEVWREAAAAVLLAEDWDVAAADPARGACGATSFVG